MLINKNIKTEPVLSKLNSDVKNVKL